MADLIQTRRILLALRRELEDDLQTVRPLLRQGILAVLNLIFCSRASVSVKPHQAISGSVKTTAGIARGSNTAFLPAITSAATFASA